jgi:hypothetical protein
MPSKPKCLVNLRGKIQMNKLTQALLAGGAIAALGSAPALAAHAPNIHLAGIKSSNIKVTVSGLSHQKSPTHNPKYVNYTTTINETLSAPESVLYHHFNLLYAWAFYDQGTTGGAPCHPIHAYKTHFKATPNVTSTHKIKQGTSTSLFACTGATITLTYYGPNYKLLSKTAKSDSFSGNLSYKKTTTGYNLHIVTPTTLTITH